MPPLHFYRGRLPYRAYGLAYATLNCRLLIQQFCKIQSARLQQLFLFGPGLANLLHHLGCIDQQVLIVSESAYFPGFEFEFLPCFKQLGRPGIFNPHELYGHQVVI